MSTIENLVVTTKREIVEEERRRLLNVPNEEDFKSWLGSREYPLDWMIAQFGETLTEKDGLTEPSGLPVDCGNCHVCKKSTKPDEKIVQIDLNSMGEDDEEEIPQIYICKKCLNDMKKMLMVKKNDV